LIPLPDGTTNYLEVSLTRPFQSTLMLQEHERRCLPRDPKLDHFYNEDSNHFPELGMDQSWLLALFSPSWNTFQNHIIILILGIATWALIPNVTARPNLSNIVRLGLTALTDLFLVTTHGPKMRLTSQQPALLIRSATKSSPVDVGYYKFMRLW
jgi:hypothetical protein